MKLSKPFHRQLFNYAKNFLHELLSNIHRINCPTSVGHTKIKPSTCCVISLAQYSIYKTTLGRGKCCRHSSTFIVEYIFSSLACVTWADLQTNPASGKACSPTKGFLICLYMQPLLVPQTTEFVICISIYICAPHRHTCNKEDYKIL